MEVIKEYLPFIIPIAVVEIILMITSLVHVLRHKKYRFGNRVLWVVISFFGFVGPILYFTIGKGEE